MTDTTRDAFEAWFAKDKGHGLIEKSETGGYIWVTTSEAWDVWQAATEQGKPQWLPIANAPKDKEILLHSTLEGVFEGHWKSAWYGDKSKCGFIAQNLDEEYGAIVRDVTHWMPLPLPPTATPQGNP